jgi:hypothetical protein
MPNTYNPIIGGSGNPRKKSSSGTYIDENDQQHYSEADARRLGLSWNSTENRWNTEIEQEGINTKAKATASDKKATDLKEGIQNFKNDAFDFNMNNPMVNALKSQFGTQEKSNSQEMARNMAARGVTDSGQMDRALIGRQQAEQGAMTQIAGSEYARQLSDWKETNREKYARMLKSYELESADYQRSMDEYWQNLTLQQEKAMDDFQKAQANDPWNKYVLPILDFGAKTADAILPG